jgi:hypothetical protein
MILQYKCAPIFVMVGIFDIEMVITGLRLIYCKGTAFEYCRGTYKESRMLLYSSTG